MQVNLLLTVLVTFSPFYHSLAMLHYKRGLLFIRLIHSILEFNSDIALLGTQQLSKAMLRKLYTKKKKRDLLFWKILDFQFFIRSLAQPT
jgi:hypothetical protein